MKNLILLVAILFTITSCSKDKPAARVCYIGYDQNNHVVRDTVPVSSSPSNTKGYIVVSAQYCSTLSVDYINTHKSEWQEDFPKVFYFK